jgi:CRP/FNR family transcriptional regulator, cyclic AMP receptor protein
MITMAALLAEQPFFAGMRPIKLEKLSYYAKRRVFRPGTRVFNEGEHADRFWVIRDGRVALDAHLPGRSDAVVETLASGAVLGWSWLFPPYAWHFGAVALAPTLTIELEGPGVLRLSQADPEIGYELSRRFMSVVVERLQATRVRLIDIYGADARHDQPVRGGMS